MKRFPSKQHLGHVVWTARSFVFSSALDLSGSMSPGAGGTRDWLNSPKIRTIMPCRSKQTSEGDQDVHYYGNNMIVMQLVESIKTKTVLILISID